MIEAPTAQDWFLRKHDDGEIFGPLPFAQLARWAFSAQVAPHDSISTDQVTWMKAPMLAELQMDWLVELTSERYYGPTTLGAIQEFMRLGEINEQTFIINSCDGTRQAIGDLPLVLQPQVEVVDAAMGETLAAPPASGMAINLQDRIRDLEQSLREERRALHEAEERYRVLELKYRKLAGKL